MRPRSSTLSIVNPGECRSWEWTVRAVLLALLLLKGIGLVLEPKLWSRADPVLPLLPMWIPLMLAWSAEVFVFLVLRERTVDPAWKGISLVSLAVLIGSYRLSGMILNGWNLSGCNCFGPVGKWLSGTASTFLAIAVLLLFLVAGLRYLSMLPHPSRQH